ncbi:MAG: PIN domain-containing protein [Acidobacteriales bacterium]|nr:PIN domain-containing protein [Terriglobales bacterium]
MARRTECYADTSAFIAFLDRSDSYHLLFKRLFATPPPLVTSALVVAEGHGWFLRRYDARRAMEFLNFLSALPMLEVACFDGEQLRQASRYVKKYADQSLTLADAHGLAVVNARRIRTCWSTDRHLSLEGAALAIY